MKKPEFTGSEITINENGIKMSTLPNELLIKMLEYQEYSDLTNAKLVEEVNILTKEKTIIKKQASELDAKFDDYIRRTDKQLVDALDAKAKLVEENERLNREHSETRQSIILLVVQRTLTFPFFFGIAFVGATIMFIKWIINFIRFGGESIAYTDKMSRKTIQDVFVKLNEMQQREQS